MRAIRVMRRVVKDADLSAEMLTKIREGIARQSSLIDKRLAELIGVCDHLARMQQAQSAAMAELLHALTQSKIPDIDIASVKQKLTEAASFQRPTTLVHETAPRGASGPSISLAKAMQSVPLLIDEKTYNTSHPDYDAHDVRNYPEVIFNRDKRSSNAAYKELLKLARKDRVPNRVWNNLLKETLEEAKSVPHAEQVFERIDYIERYIAELTETYGAYYRAGWVNLEDALFLYWLVRKLKPKTIVQTGVCNGLSSAFMVLALAKNGGEGKLHAIDLANIFDPKDPSWTQQDRVYGVVIPEGKNSGWIVPDAYRDRFEVQQGDAKKLLPPLIAKLPSVDMFYHDSDHTYNHMMFEFREAKKKLNPGGLIVGDDISWNASVWDFADEYGVPSYNYKGAVGVAFF